ncbi:MAG: hypothetical protein HOV80_31580 [Polyangiaceae bacterium]|nr:hypothetical protein [Polyangiaceae bacterium]
MPAPSRKALASSAFFVVSLCASREALAVENEWHVGGAFGYSMLVTSVGSISGGGGLVHFRYGLTDALDLAFDGGVSGFPPTLLVPEADPENPGAAPGEPVQAPSFRMMDTEAGLSYVGDVGRFIPHVGVQAGVSDLMVVSCDDNPDACGQDIRPTIGIPAGFEVRTVGPLVLGAHFRYRFLIGGDPSGQLFAGAYFAFVPNPKIESAF